MSMSQERTQLTSATALVRLGELTVRSSDFTHHKSAMTNKKIMFLPPFKSLPY